MPKPRSDFSSLEEYEVKPTSVKAMRGEERKGNLALTGDITLDSRGRGYFSFSGRKRWLLQIRGAQGKGREKRGRMGEVA